MSTTADDVKSYILILYTLYYTFYIHHCTHFWKHDSFKNALLHNYAFTFYPMSFYKLDKALLNGQYNFKPKLGSRNHLVKYSI